MLVKVLKLQGGEQLISGIAEVSNEAGEGIGFQLTHPYVLSLVPSGEVGEDGQPNTFNVNYTRWVSCSSENTFRVPYSAIVALGDPEAQVLETYRTKFGDLIDDNDTVPTVNPDIVPEGSELPNLGDSGEG
jgi:hypothetical protein